MSQIHPWDSPGLLSVPPEQVTIIGAGIAAWSLWHALNRRGIDCLVVSPDKPDGRFSGASGNRQAVIMPWLTAQPSREESLLTHAFEYARQAYPAESWHPTGVLRWLDPHNPGSRCWHQAITRRLTASGAQQPQTAVHNQPDGILFAQAGWLDPAMLLNTTAFSLCRHRQATVACLRQSKTGGWQLLDASDRLIIHSQVVVAASGPGLTATTLDWFDEHGRPHRRPLAHDWTLSIRHGQVSELKITNKTVDSRVILGRGYLVPPAHGISCIGASFDHIPVQQWQKPARLLPDHDHRNRNLWRHTPWWPTVKNAPCIGGRAGLRVTTADHLPLAGPVIDPAHFCHHYRDLHHGRHWQHYPPARVLPGLFVLGGLGARGFSTAPWLAEQLACQIGNEAPADRDLALWQSIHPNRFLYRRLRRPGGQPIDMLSI